MDPDLNDMFDKLVLYSGYIQRNFNLIKQLDQKSQTIIETIERRRDQQLTKSEDNYGLDLNDLYSKVESFSDHKLGLTKDSRFYINKSLQLLDKNLSNLEIREKQLEKLNQQKKSITLKSHQKDNKTLFKYKPELKTRHIINSLVKRSIANKLVKKKKNTFSVRDVPNDGNSIETNLIVSRRSRRTKHTQNNRFNCDNFVFTPFKPRSLPKSEIKRETNIEESDDFVGKKSLTEWSEPNPSELVYCICRSVSFGEMIACSNKGCRIQWFHFGCVNLRDKPKGQWFCPKCLPNDSIY